MTCPICREWESRSGLTLRSQRVLTWFLIAIAESVSLGLTLYVWCPRRGRACSCLAWADDGLWVTSGILPVPTAQTARLAARSASAARRRAMGRARGGSDIPARSIRPVAFDRAAGAGYAGQSSPNAAAGATWTAASAPVCSVRDAGAGDLPVPGPGLGACGGDARDLPAQAHGI